MLPDPDDRQCLIISKLHERLVLETQKLSDMDLRLRLTLTLGLFREQLAGNPPPLLSEFDRLVPGWIHARSPALRVVRTDGEPEAA